MSSRISTHMFQHVHTVSDRTLLIKPIRPTVCCCPFLIYIICASNTHKHTHSSPCQPYGDPRQELRRCVAALRRRLWIQKTEVSAPSLPCDLFQFQPGPSSALSGQRKLALWGHLDMRGERRRRQTAGTAVPETQAPRSDASVMLI